MSERLTYKGAGVDVEAASAALGPIAAAAARTHGPDVLGGIGGFGGVLRLDDKRALVCSIDGVGTKTAVARMAGDYSGLGADIVNHCANDILCQGARPLAFLDYFGCSRLDADALCQVVESAAAACEAAGCALLGGETAEMPGVYASGEIDVVGAIVGMVDPNDILPRKALEGDALVGLPSSGLHTNGYSLARRALFEVGLSPEPELMAALLEPHRSYLWLLDDLERVRALAHVTGGGIAGNLSRVIPDGLCATVNANAWSVPPIFGRIAQAGWIEREEMFAAFNMGVGMIAVVASGDAAALAESWGGFVIGEVVAGDERARLRL